MKRRAMKTYIINESLFRDVGAPVCVIEFQERGLPHAQCIFFLIESSKIALLQPNAMSSIISAEILSSDSQVLCNVIMKQHTPNP